MSARPVSDPSWVSPDVLGCEVPACPRVRRLSLGLEDMGGLSVRAWLGEEEEGTQLEMIAALEGLWSPWLVTMGGLNVRGNVASAIVDRFGVKRTDARSVELLLMRSGMIGSIAVEAGGVEGLREFELQVWDRLTESEGFTA